MAIVTQSELFASLTANLQRSGCCEAKIRLLRKCRCRLLEQIHQKQQALDRLDYLIYRMKNPKE